MEGRRIAGSGFILGQISLVFSLNQQNLLIFRYTMADVRYEAGGGN